MNIASAELGDGVTRIDLAGRLDVAGAEAIDVPFAGIVSTIARGVVVDLSRVTFVASIGLRTLVTNAKTLKRRGGTMVLLSPVALVEEALRAAGIHEVIPVAHDLRAALDAVKAAPSAEV